MKYSDYLKVESQLKRQLATADRKWFFVREALRYGGIMALVLTITDLTSWPLGQTGPLGRLFFIVVWSLAMAWWELSRIRQVRARA